MKEKTDLGSVINERDNVQLIAFVAASSHTTPEVRNLAANILSSASVDDLLNAEEVLNQLIAQHPDDDSYRYGFDLIHGARLCKQHPKLRKTILTMLKENT